MTKEELNEKIIDIYMNLTTNYDSCNYSLIDINRDYYEFVPTELLNEKDCKNHSVVIILNTLAINSSGLIIPEKEYDNVYDYADRCNCSKIVLDIDGINYPVNLTKKQLGESLEALNKIINEFQESRINAVWMATKSTEIDSTDDLD